MKRIPKQGQLVGTAAALPVSLGFRPVYVRVYNKTNLMFAEAFGTMTAAHFVSTDDSGAGTTDIAHITSAGITITNTGFTLGTNATLNSASDEIHYVAF